MSRASLRRDIRGGTLLEFTFVAPVMVVLMMALCDLLYGTYARAILNGAVQKAARDSTLQGASVNDLDQKVMTVMGGLIGATTQSCATDPAAGTWCATRVSYSSFTQTGPEPFSDDNNDGIRQPTECYSDVNGNTKWDATPDPGASGQGGASDVTVYTMRVTYPRLLPVAGLLGWSPNQTITGSTTLKNQPYQSQSSPATAPAVLCTP